MSWTAQPTPGCAARSRRASRWPAWTIDCRRAALVRADGSALVMPDRDSGHVDDVLPLPGPPDVVMYDPELHHLHVAIGDPGVILVADTKILEVMETVITEPGAHTLAIDPDRRAVDAFLPASGGAAVYLDQ